MVLKILAGIEFILAVVLLILVLWALFLLVAYWSPSNEGTAYVLLFLILTAPIMLALFTASIGTWKSLDKEWVWWVQGGLVLFGLCVGVMWFRL